jgi:hypothetical protein
VFFDVTLSFDGRLIIIFGVSVREKLLIAANVRSVLAVVIDGLDVFSEIESVVVEYKLSSLGVSEKVDGDESLCSSIELVKEL